MENTFKPSTQRHVISDWGSQGLHRDSFSPQTKQKVRNQTHDLKHTKQVLYQKATTKAQQLTVSVNTELNYVEKALFF